MSEIERLVEKLGVEVLSARDQHGYTPAHWAALDGSVAVMRYLVERGAPVDLSCLGTQVLTFSLKKFFFNFNIFKCNKCVILGTSPDSLGLS